MNPEIKKLWVEDLRKNPPQIQGFLKTSKGHCCLGRLCELHKSKVEGEDWERACSEQTSTRYSYFYEAEHLPNEVKNWAELESTKIKLSLISQELKEKYDLNDANFDIDLAMLNDRDMTFLEIADIIEAHL